MRPLGLPQLQGCLCGGAMGDALGAPVKFLAYPVIVTTYGEHGITKLPSTAAGSDNSQQMIFVLEGLLRAHLRQQLRGSADASAVVHHALMRWLHTQQASPWSELLQRVDKSGWLLQQQPLFERRTPGLTSIAALEQSQYFGDLARNHSKGCGALTRAAPFAFFPMPWQLAFQSARHTHGHPTAAFASAFFAHLLAQLWQNDISLHQAVLRTLAYAVHQQSQSSLDNPIGNDVLVLVKRVLQFVQQEYAPTPSRIHDFAEGWVAEEALAVGLWCALFADDFASGIRVAVNHSGNSDACGMVCGNLLGLLFSEQALSPDWLTPLTLAPILKRLSDDFYQQVHQEEGDLRRRQQLLLQYPAW